jgi:hypothetical protein
MHDIRAIQNRLLLRNAVWIGIGQLVGTSCRRSERNTREQA